MSDLARDCMMFRELANELDADVTDMPEVVEGDLDQALIVWATLEEANRVLAIVRRNLASRLGNGMHDKRRIIPNVGVIERNARRDGSTKCIDEDGLWRLVLDTRIVDEETGEVMPQAEIIRRVYGSESKETGKVRLTGSSPAKAEAVLDIDADEFFTKAPVVGWSLRLIASDNAPAKSEEAA